MNILDKVIYQVAPKWGLQRHLNRKRLEFAQSYDGATNTYRGSSWARRNTSANAEIQKGGKLVRARVRELVRNNPWAVRIKSVLVNNTIGTGIVPDIPIKAAAKAWESWAGTSVCDTENRLDFYGIQRLAFGSMVESGEVLIRRVWTKDSIGIPFKIQTLDPDFLCADNDGPTSSGGMVRGGKEKNSAGVLTHYHLYKSHPGDDGIRSLEDERIPAKDIIHLYREDRPSQDSGISWYAPIVVELNDFAEFQDAQLVKHKIASKWTAFIYDKDLPINGDYPDLSDHMESGSIEFLPAGKDIRFPDMPSAGNYMEYSKMHLHSISAAMDVTFESVTGFYDDTNFASGRMGFVEADRSVKSSRRDVVIPKLCRRVFEWFTEACIVSGVPVVRNQLDVTWSPPRREMFDPVKEGKAQKDMIRAGLKTLTGTILENGDSPEKIFNQHKKDFELLDKYGLKFDSDYRNELQKMEAGNAETVPVSPEK